MIVKVLLNILIVLIILDIVMLVLGYIINVNQLINVIKLLIFINVEIMVDLKIGKIIKYIIDVNMWLIIFHQVKKKNYLILDLCLKILNVEIEIVFIKLKAIVLIL